MLKATSNPIGHKLFEFLLWNIIQSFISFQIYFFWYIQCFLWFNTVSKSIKNYSHWFFYTFLNFMLISLIFWTAFFVQFFNWSFWVIIFNLKLFSFKNIKILIFNMLSYHYLKSINIMFSIHRNIIKSLWLILIKYSFIIFSSWFRSNKWVKLKVLKLISPHLIS